MAARGRLVRASLFLLVSLAIAAPMVAQGAGAGLQHAGNIAFSGGSDVEVQGSLAYVGSDSSGSDGGLWIVDINDPAEPAVVGRFPCTGSPNNLAVRGALAVIAFNNSGGPASCTPRDANGIRILDVGDPTDPKQISVLSLPDYERPILPGGILFAAGPAVIDVTFVTDTILYLTPGAVSSKTFLPQTFLDPDPTKIVDISDPSHPVIVGEFAPAPGSGCEDITVRGDRAYCADSEVTQIWDVSDPVHPALVSTIFNPFFNMVVAAVASEDGDTLLVADEQDDVSLCEPGGRLPIGAIWIYDITSEKEPALRGYLGPTDLLNVGLPYASQLEESVDLGKQCSARSVSLVPGRDWAVVAWGIAGTSIVDFSDPMSPKTVAWNRPDLAEAEAARYGGGAVVTADPGRGIDIFSMPGLSARNPVG